MDGTSDAELETDNLDKNILKNGVKPTENTGTKYKSDVLYLKSIVDIKDKLKSALASPRSYCPNIQERLYRHQLECHKSRHHSYREDSPEKTILSKNIEKEKSKHERIEKLKNNLESETRKKRNKCIQNNINVSTKSTSKDNLCVNTLKKWVDDVTEQSDNGVHRDENNIIKELVHKIYSLANEEQEIDNNNTLFAEIEHLINKLPINTKNENKSNHFKENEGQKIKKHTETINKRNQIDCKTKKINNNEVFLKRVESEILDLVLTLDFRAVDDASSENIIDIIDTFMIRLTPLLTNQGTIENHELIIKSTIFSTLKEITCISRTNDILYLDNIAKEITNKLVSLYNKYQNNNEDQNNQSIKYVPNVIYNGGRNNFSEDLDDSAIKVRCILNELFESIFFGRYQCDKVLRLTKTNPDAKILIKNAKNVGNSMIKQCPSESISVFTMRDDSKRHINYPITSTPKQTHNNTLFAQSFKDTSYFETVNEIVLSWVKTLFDKHKNNEKFKEDIVKDLVVNIIDQSKLEQLIPNNDYDRNKIRSYIIFQWLYRFHIFDERSGEIPEVKDLINQLNNIAAPHLSKTIDDDHENIKNLNHEKSDHVLDMLQNEISIWVNQQSPETLSDTASKQRSILVKQLAGTLLKCFKKKNEDKCFNKAITKWLKDVIKVSQKDNINKLTKSLKNRILDITQVAKMQSDSKSQTKSEIKYENVYEEPNNNEIIMKDALKTTNQDSDQIIKELILKYIEYYYDAIDPVTKRAFEIMLSDEILALDSCNESDNVKEQYGSKQRLDQELKLIQIISDWLEELSFNRQFNTPNILVDDVCGLAKDIYDTEKERLNDPTAKDYDDCLKAIVNAFISKLAGFTDDSDAIQNMSDKLVHNIISVRPFCQNCQQDDLSKYNMDIQSIGDFVDYYIYSNILQFASYVPKLDAWSARLIEEAKRIVRDHSKDKLICERKSYILEIGSDKDEILSIFIKKLDYIIAVSDWTKNMPVLIKTDADKIKMATMIKDLAEMISESDRKQINSNELINDNNLKEYLKNWLHNIPKRPNKNILDTLLIHQILKTVCIIRDGSKVNNNLLTSIEIHSVDVSVTKSLLSQPKHRSKHSKHDICSKKSKHPTNTMIETIENWSKSLPIKHQNNEETYIIKNNIARKLYQKVGDLIMDTEITGDDLLFEELVCDEIDKQLAQLQNYSDIQRKRESLKNNLITNLIKAKSYIQDDVAEEIYKEELENTLDVSTPSPLSNSCIYDLEFKIYKNYVIHMFILQNFDHGTDDNKINYEKRIKMAIDKHFEGVQKRNNILLNNDEVYNELYGALFKVSIPDDKNTQKLILEIKTRCEIDEWFEKLPIHEANCLNELLEQDKILDVLSKRLCEIENGNKHPDDKMQAEIVKWLEKLPLIKDYKHEINTIAKELVLKLKETSQIRKCVVQPNNSKNIKIKEQMNKNKNCCNQSKNLETEHRNSKKCCQFSDNSKKTSSELIFDIVNAWCDQLPIPVIETEDEEQYTIIKNDIITKLLMKISEINCDPNIYNDCNMYEHILSEEVKDILSYLSINSTDAIDSFKMQLINELKLIHSVIEEERSCYEYKEKLKSTISKVLPSPDDTTLNITALFEDLRQDIVDNFIQYNYNYYNDRNKYAYRQKLYDLVIKYNEIFKYKTKSRDYLIQQNMLLCELSKIAIPSKDAFKDVVEEVLMKNEVNEFFNELALPKEKKEIVVRDNIKSDLAKRLHDIEKTGHNCSNRLKMKKEIVGSLKKINFEVNQEKVAAFIKKLKHNEDVRKQASVKVFSFDDPTQKSDSFSNKSKLNKSNENLDNASSSKMSKDFSTNTSFSPLGFESSKSNKYSKKDIKCHCSHSKGSTDNKTSGYVSDEKSPGISRPNVSFQDNKDIDLTRTVIVPIDKKSNKNNFKHSESCKCRRKVLKSYRAIPRRVLNTQNFCKSCEHLSPMWMIMPYPRTYLYI